jgi:hypothetical protein
MDTQLLISIGCLLLMLISSKKILTSMQEMDTAMQIRKGLLNAQKMYKKQYEFKPRVLKLSISNRDGVLDFVQFRGRL